MWSRSGAGAAWLKVQWSPWDGGVLNLPCNRHAATTFTNFSYRVHHVSSF